MRVHMIAILALTAVSCAHGAPDIRETKMPCTLAPIGSVDAWLSLRVPSGWQEILLDDGSKPGGAQTCTLMNGDRSATIIVMADDASLSSPKERADDLAAVMCRDGRACTPIHSTPGAASYNWTRSSFFSKSSGRVMTSLSGDERKVMFTFVGSWDNDSAKDAWTAFNDVMAEALIRERKTVSAQVPSPYPPPTRPYEENTLVLDVPDGWHLETPTSSDVNQLFAHRTSGASIGIRQTSPAVRSAMEEAVALAEQYRLAGIAVAAVDGSDEDAAFAWSRELLGRKVEGKVAVRRMAKSRKTMVVFLGRWKPGTEPKVIADFDKVVRTASMQ